MKIITKAIESAQKQVEAQNFEMRKNVLKYDDVMNRQRHAIYGDRRKVLGGHQVDEQLRETVDRVVRSGVLQYTTGLPDDWDLDTLWTEMRKLFPVHLEIDDYLGEDDPQQLADAFAQDAARAYDAREESLGAENMRELERQVWLTVLDRKWREHLYEMDYLREGIGLRAMAQRDPLVEYQREGAQMFDAMREGFAEEVVGYLFNIDVQVVPDNAGPQLSAASAAATAGQLAGALGGARADRSTDAEPAAQPPQEEAAAASPAQPSSNPSQRKGKPLRKPPVRATEDEPAPTPAATVAASAEAARKGSVHIKGAAAHADSSRLSYSAPDEQGAVSKSGRDTGSAGDDLYAGVGRNQPCPCGSGKKFKLCHGRNPNAA